MNRLRFIPPAIFALTLVWYGALVFRFRTHGAIGDDPATYVQMALDLAQRGTVTHSFPLFNNLFDQNLSWDAFFTPGYHVVRETGVIAPNFAFGFPLLLAIGLRAFGEGALYWATPIMGALALVVTFALGGEFWRNLSRPRRYRIGALAVLLLATTPKQIQLALVPMSDVPTQLFCVLAILCALRVRQSETDDKQAADAQRRSGAFSGVGSYPLRLAGLCGLSLGIAYLIRHSALVMVIPLAIVMARWGSSRRERIVLMAVALVVFVLAILPDIVYRTSVLGSPFTVESPESSQMDWLAAPQQILQIGVALFSITGFGPILLALPALCIGLEKTENRRATLVLSVWILAFVLFHAPLRLTGVFENSLRYLVPAYPAIALLIGRSMVALVDGGWNAVRVFREKRLSLYHPRHWDFALLCAIVAIVLFGLAIRALLSPERFVQRAYGWMSEPARRDMDALARDLPSNAVIGVSDQMAGATMLYAQRDIFRPLSLVEPLREFPQFLQVMREENRPVYLLGDWNCSPLAGGSEMLPEWLETGDWRLETGSFEVRDLPYECAQRVWQVK